MGLEIQLEIISTKSKLCCCLTVGRN